MRSDIFPPPPPPLNSDSIFLLYRQRPLSEEKKGGGREMIAFCFLNTLSLRGEKRRGRGACEGKK